MNQHEQINYLELPAKNLEATQTFFESVFAWCFTGYGPDYTAFSNSIIKGGFYRADECSRTRNGAALIVFYSLNLQATQAKIEAHGGEIVKPVFSFPGGRRFHFIEPSGNEFAVWSDVGV